MRPLPANEKDDDSCVRHPVVRQPLLFDPGAGCGVWYLMFDLGTGCGVWYLMFDLGAGCGVWYLMVFDPGAGCGG